MTPALFKKIIGRIREERSFRLGLIGIAAVACIPLLFYYISQPSSPVVAYAEIKSGIPQRIKIERMHINAAIEPVALTQDGLLLGPKSALNTGWYDKGPKPGEDGTAIINGYVNWKHGNTAMFADLHFLEPGDIVSVENDLGVTQNFVVRESRTFDLDANIGAIVSEGDGRPRLNLMTHDGAWDKKSKSYSKRLVVFTEKIISPSSQK